MYILVKQFDYYELSYQLGYSITNNKILPRIDIYNKQTQKMLCYSIWDYNENNFYYSIYFIRHSFSSGYIDSIEELFEKLRRYIKIDSSIEEEFKNIFLIYKLNDFKKI